MSTFHLRDITCTCGHRFGALLADSVNEARMPDVRQEILDGTFHRVTCPGCDRRMTIEKSFLYVNFQRNSITKVMPRQDRHLWKQASADLNRSTEAIPEALSPAGNRKLRVVFGLAELREKLVAEDAGLDDRLVELLKVFVIADHPFLVQKPRLRLALHSATPAEAEFRASFEHDPGQFSIKVPESVLNDLLGRRKTLQEWANRSHGADSFFNLKDDWWVNLWRFSPQPSALEKLHSYADEIASGKDINTSSEDFQWMLTYVPRGNHLPTFAKRDLGILFDYASRKKLPELEAALFQIRFGVALSDD
jgi:CpXC protein